MYCNRISVLAVCTDSHTESDTNSSEADTTPMFSSSSSQRKKSPDDRTNNVLFVFRHIEVAQFAGVFKVPCSVYLKFFPKDYS